MADTPNKKANQGKHGPAELCTYCIDCLSNKRQELAPCRSGRHYGLQKLFKKRTVVCLYPGPPRESSPNELKLMREGLQDATQGLEVVAVIGLGLVDESKLVEQAAHRLFQYAEMSVRQSTDSVLAKYLVLSTILYNLRKSCADHGGTMWLLRAEGTECKQFTEAKSLVQGLHNLLWARLEQDLPAIEFLRDPLGRLVPTEQELFNTQQNLWRYGRHTLHPGYVSSLSRSSPLQQTCEVTIFGSYIVDEDPPPNSESRGDRQIYGLFALLPIMPILPCFTVTHVCVRQDSAYGWQGFLDQCLERYPALVDVELESRPRLIEQERHLTIGRNVLQDITLELPGLEKLSWSWSPTVVRPTLMIKDTDSLSQITLCPPARCHPDTVCTIRLAEFGGGGAQFYQRGNADKPGSTIVITQERKGGELPNLVVCVVAPEFSDHQFDPTKHQDRVLKFVSLSTPSIRIENSEGPDHDVKASQVVDIELENVSRSFRGRATTVEAHGLYLRNNRHNLAIDEYCVVINE